MSHTSKTVVHETLLYQLLSFDLVNHQSYRYTKLFIESFFVMTLACWLPYIFHFEQSAVYSLFVVSFALLERAHFLLEENKQNIWSRQLGGWKSNALSANSILAIFVGIFLAALCFATLLLVLYSPQELKSTFAFFLRDFQLDASNGIATRFTGFIPIFTHNLLVMVTLSVVVLCYRAYGLILVLAWNACVWGGVFALFFWLGFTGVKVSGVVVVLQSFVAVFPHLLLEAAAYIMGALAALFLSKGVTKYEFGDERFLSVIKVSGLLFVVALITLAIAGLVEVTLPPRLMPF